MPGSGKFTISDTLTNRGSEPQEFMPIYHANYGSPLLEQGAWLVAAAERVAPFNDHAAKAVKTWDTYAAPKSGFVEEAFQIFPFADKKGRTTIQLQNAKGDRGVDELVTGRAALSHTMEKHRRQIRWLRYWPRARHQFPTQPPVGTCQGPREQAGPEPVAQLRDHVWHSNTQAEVTEVARSIQALQGDRRTRVLQRPEADPFNNGDETK